jgi:hypothetical protein
MIKSGQQRAFLLASSRDPLYLCCRTPATKDAASPGAKWKHIVFWVTTLLPKTHNSPPNQRLVGFEIL